MWSRLSPSGEASKASDLLSDRRLLLWGLAALTVFRLVCAGLTPLTEDEAYYRLWAMSPQLGYYDHPPMIAWWIALGRTIAGDDSLGVRLLPVLGGAGVTLLLWDAARLAGASERIAARAALWLNATLLIGFGVILAVPDAPSTLFWTATLWSLLKARKTGRPEWWLLAGVTAGLATLSKYSALFLAPGVFLWLVLTPEGRADLKKPWPWLTCVIAAALFGLNAWWNWGHHWESFSKQFGRAAPGALTPKFLGELIVSQVLLINPLLVLFAWRPFDLRKLKAWPADVAVFVATTVPFLAYLVLHSLHARVQAHWPAPVYPALAFLAAVAAEGVRPSTVYDRLKSAVAPVGIGLTVLTLAYAASGLDLLGRADPSLPLRGWPAFARAIDAERARDGAAWVGTQAYGTAAQLSAQSSLIKAPVLQLEERERYIFLPPSAADLTKPGLVVDLARRDAETALKACFNEVRAVGTLIRGPVKVKNTTYSAFLVSGPKTVVEGGCSP